MLKKTAEKLKRRFESKPLHHIDTSVIIEPENTIEGKFCKKYLQKIGYNYRGALSFPCMSELFLIMNSFEDFNIRYDFLESLRAMIKARRISFYRQGNTSLCL